MRRLALIVAIAGCAGGDEPSLGALVQPTTVQNGSFEADYAGWTLLETPPTDQTFGTFGIATDGQIIQPGELAFDFADAIDVSQGSPGLPITFSATDGARLAFNLQNGPQNHRMFQTVAIPSCATTLSWEMAYQNHNGAFDVAQQFTAVNIRDAADQILATPFKTDTNAPAQVAPMTTFNADISAFAGQTVVIDFEHQVQQFFFDVAWDNVRFDCDTDLGVDPLAVAFGNQRVGTTSTPQAVTLSNLGTADITVTAITTAPPFAVSVSLPVTLGPGAQLAFTTTFSPTATGAATGSITVTSSDPSPLSIPLSGTGTAPDIAVDTPTLDFGNQRVATTGTSSVVVTNTGTDTLSITAITATPPFASQTTAPIAIAPGNSAPIDVAFTPTAAGDATGTLTIVSDAATSPTTVTLTGTGTGPDIAAPPLLAFGPQRVGTTSPTRQVTVQNTGTEVLVITAITAPAPFSLIAPTTFPVQVPVGEALVVDLGFTPTTTTTFASTLTIESDALSAATTNVDLTGEGVVPGLTASTASLGFGTVKVGGASAGQVVTLANTSLLPVLITSAVVPSQFAIEGAAFPLSLLPSASAAITVRFAPTASGPASGTLTFVTDADPAPAIQLDGVGGNAMLATDVDTIDFGGVPVDTTSAPVAVTLRNAGAGTLVISGIEATSPFTRASVQLPVTIEAGGTLSINVLFRPTADGGASGTLTIQSDGGMLVIPLTGEGLAIDVADDSGCCSSSGGVGSAWLGLGVLALLFRRRRR